MGVEDELEELLREARAEVRPAAVEVGGEGEAKGRYTRQVRAWLEWEEARRGEVAVASTVLFGEYCAWAAAAGIGFLPMSAKSFGRAMSRLRFVRCRVARGNRYAWALDARSAASILKQSNERRGY
ncbi:MAG: hypothetical protein ACYC9X_00640 [Dehalococcoidia bacterium]